MLRFQRIYLPYQSAVSCTIQAPVTGQLVPSILPAADVELITQLPQTSHVKSATPTWLSLHLTQCQWNNLKKWCIVRYQGNIYPGIVTDIDDVDIGP